MKLRRVSKYLRLLTYVNRDSIFTYVGGSQKSMDSSGISCV